MNGSFKLAAPLAMALAVAACNAGGSSGMVPTTGQSAASTQAYSDWKVTGSARRACPDARPGVEECDALVINSQIGPAVSGWGPADFQAAYDLPSSSKGGGQIVAVVDAFDNPNVASDLAVYRSNFGLPTANFTKYNQEGKIGDYPKGDPGWGTEIDLDVQMVSATCPNCTIYLVEAKTNSSKNLYAAEKEAVKLGATVVTNSWGGGGGGSTRGAFNTAGIVYLASAGDSGYGMQDPADYQTVVSVGGTLLSKSSSAYSERVWPSSGGGCSKIAKPSWQTDPKCKKRTGNDVSAVAWGVAIYDTYPNGGWGTVGGTSVSSPLVAGVYGLAGNSGSQDGGKVLWTLSKKQLKSGLNAINNGQVSGCPSQYAGTYICVAGTGEFGTYSGPTGWGSPHGISAF
ncbi:MAG TPA: S8 family serine peptidase [Candidatus Binatia bacterium]|nr:S8 family serine peptidase [Candidatus Binatia bacterium]